MVSVSLGKPLPFSEPQVPHLKRTENLPTLKGRFPYSFIHSLIHSVLGQSEWRGRETRRSEGRWGVGRGWGGSESPLLVHCRP